MNVQWLVKKITESSGNYPHKIFEEKGKIYTCINSFKYHIFHKNPQSYENMDGIFVDGILMCKFIKLFWGKKVRRLSFDMTSIAKDLFPLIEANGKTIYFIGDQEEMISQAVEVFKKSYPGMQIVGWHSGFFKNEEERGEIIQKIVNLSPDYTIIGMGGLIQERFAIDLKNKDYEGIAFTCGGFFHQSVNKLHYYPTWVDKYNLRMPYRLIKERTYKRLWHIVVTFPFYFLIDRITSKK